MRWGGEQLSGGEVEERCDGWSGSSGVLVPQAETTAKPECRSDVQLNDLMRTEYNEGK